MNTPEFAPRAAVARIPRVPLFLQAVQFARLAHAGAARKYTGAPYITHPMAVARVLYEHGLPLPVVIAGVLHDVLEDTGAPARVLADQFGLEVLHLVQEVTELPRWGTRKARKAQHLLELAAASSGAQSLKLGDILDNISGAALLPPSVAKVYVPEKRDQWAVLAYGDARLHARVGAALARAEAHFSRAH